VLFPVVLFDSLGFIVVLELFEELVLLELLDELVVEVLDPFVLFDVLDGELLFEGWELFAELIKVKSTLSIEGPTRDPGLVGFDPKKHRVFIFKDIMGNCWEK
jgi:hypothetical protein